MLQKTKECILDTLFPITCLSCQKNGFWLCEECTGKIKIKEEQVCPKCEMESTISGFLCSNCRIEKSSYLDALISATAFNDPIIKKLVYCYKYRFVDNLAEMLSQIMSKALLVHDIPLPSAIVPVPLHKKRLRWRGFNQAELLAQRVSFRLVPVLSIPVLDILTRKKYNKPQMEVKGYLERLKNVEGLFAIKPNADMIMIRGKSILLVDDIATTGATLEECAKILKKNGAKKIFAAVIARQAIKRK